MSSLLFTLPAALLAVGAFVSVPTPARAAFAVPSGPPPPEALAPAPSTERAPQSFALGAHGGVRSQACFSAESNCGQLGLSLGARFDFRPVAWFTFGVHADWFTLHDAWSRDALSVSRKLNAFDLLADARIHWLYQGNHDVSTSVGVGYVLGSALGETREELVRTGETFGDTQQPSLAAHWSKLTYGPLGRVALTWLWRSPFWLQTGLEFNLDYWAESAQGRCGTAPSSACRNAWLSPENMAFTLALLLQLPLGRSL